MRATSEEIPMIAILRKPKTPTHAEEEF